MQKEHPTFTVRAHALWLIPGILFALVFVALLVRISLEPRYLGKTAGQWFPFFPKGGQRFVNLPEELTTGKMETLPVLIAATQLQAPWWLPYTRFLPQKVASKIPQPVDVRQIQSFAAYAISESAQSPRFAKALAEHLEELPLDAQLQLNQIYEGPSKALIDARLLPVFKRKLRTAAFRERVALAYQLLRFEGLSDDTLRDLIALVVEFVEPAANRSKRTADPATLFALLGRVGPISETLTVPLRHLLPRLAAKERFELRLALTRLNPVTFTASSLFAEAADSKEAFAQFESVHFLFKNASRDHALSENLGPILEECLRYHGGSEREDVVVRNKVSMLMEFAFRTPPALPPGWVDSFLVGLDDPSRLVRRASAWTLYQLKATSHEAIARAGQLLEAGREPELALLILTQARELPARVEPLVRALAAGEPVKNWTPEPPPDREVTEPARVATRSKTLQQFAQSLLTSVRQRTSHRL